MVGTVGLNYLNLSKGDPEHFIGFLLSSSKELTDWLQATLN